MDELTSNALNFSNTNDARKMYLYQINEGKKKCDDTTGRRTIANLINQLL